MQTDRNDHASSQSGLAPLAASHVGQARRSDSTDTAMSETYHVRLNKDYLVFSAAHFITFAGNVCERLHGHNYGLEVEIEGPLDENAYVIDFIALRDAAKEITDALDHRMLLPTNHDQIKVVASDKEVTVTFEDRRWLFPREDCVLLEIPNTTTELLARHIGMQLMIKLGLGKDTPFNRLTVGVDENRGQWGVWTQDSL